MTNVMTLSYLITNVYSPYLKQVRQPHPSMYDSLIRSDELYNRLKIITNLKKIDDVANLSRLYNIYKDLYRPPLFGRDTGLDCVITIQRLVETESFTNKNKKELEIGYKCSLKFFLFNEDVE